MSLNKSLENIVIEFDLNKCKVKILHNFGVLYNSFDINEFVYDNEFIGDDLISDLLSNALGSYLKNKKFELPDVYIVLPNDLVHLENLTIPVMQDNKIKEVIKTEIKKLYNDYAKYDINTAMVGKNKKQASYTVAMVDKGIVMACHNVCKKFGLNLKSISFKSNSICNSFLALGGKVKHSNFIFVNIEDEQTELIYVSHDKLIKFLELPFGQSQQDKKYIVDILKQNSADFLMYNTFSGTSGDLITFDYSNDFMKKFKQQQNEKVSKQISRQNSVDELLEKGESETKLFDIIINYIDMFSESIKEQNLGTVENIIINSKLTDELFFDKFKDVYKTYKSTDEISNNVDLLDNLSLYGMIYAVIYNKGNNFVDKEKQNMIGKIATYFSFLFRRIKNFLSRNLTKEKDGVKKNK